jgi:hypothetical protein
MIAVMDFLQIEDANIPTLPAKQANKNASNMYINRVIHDRPPTKNDKERSGRLAITNIITLITADPILPSIIAGADIVVVRRTSMVFLSRSPEMDDAVIIGTISAIITSSVIPTAGKKYMYPLYTSTFESTP